MAGIFMPPMKLIFLALSLHNFSLKGHDFVFEETTCQNGFVISAFLLRMKLNEAGLLVNETGIDRTKTISLVSSTGSLSLCLFILSGDIALNPGPKYHYPCGACSKPVKVNQKGVQCDSCNAWYHTKCWRTTYCVYHTGNTPGIEQYQFQESLWPWSDPIPYPQRSSHRDCSIHTVPIYTIFGIWKCAKWLADGKYYILITALSHWLLFHARF